MLFLLLTTLLTTEATQTTSLTPAQGRGTLLQVQVIARHGARTALTKTATSLLEGGAALTPIGEKQLYDLGVWLRERYKKAEHREPLPMQYRASESYYQINSMPIMTNIIKLAQARAHPI